MLLDSPGMSPAQSTTKERMDEALDKQEAPQAVPETDEPGQDAPTPTDEAVDPEVAATVEAILFSTDGPISPAKIAMVAELPGRGLVKKAVALLNERYDENGSAFRIEPIAGGYQMMTRPEYHDVVGRLMKNRGDSKLSQASMETLAIIAYRQPILRADVEAIRGVASGEVIRNLLEKNLVKITGRAEVLGRPMLYGTTRRFLEVFGLNSIDDLPNVEALRGGRDAEADKQPATDEPADEADQGEDESQEAPGDSPEPQADEPEGEAEDDVIL